MNHGGTRKESGPGQMVKLLHFAGYDARHWVHGRKCRCGQYVLANTEKGWPDIDVMLGDGRLAFIEWKGGDRKSVV